MITATIIFFGLLIILGLLLGIISDNPKDWAVLTFWAIILVIIFTVLEIIDINKPTTNKSSKTKITPELKIETKVINNEIVSVDTTYIYTFPN